MTLGNGDENGILEVRGDEGKWEEGGGESEKP